MNLLERLLQTFPNAKIQTLKRMAQGGRVQVNGAAAVRLKQEISPQDVVRVLPESPPPKMAGRKGMAPREAMARAPDIAGRIQSNDANGIVIVFEDADVLVIDKPAGLLTSTVPGERRPTALAAVMEYFAGGGESRGRREPRGKNALKVGLIHRLDRDASGLLVFSKNAAAYRSLKSQFFHHKAARIYAAIVSPLPNPKIGRIESHLVEWADGSVHSTRQEGRGQRAITHYETIGTRGKKVALLRVMLETGRKHQIRAHLSERGWPIVGDEMYGGAPDEGGLMLAAVRLELDHPRTGERLKFELALPRRMKPAGDGAVF